MKTNRINAELNAQIKKRLKDQPPSGKSPINKDSMGSAEVLIVDISKIKVFTGIKNIAEALISSIMEKHLLKRGDVYVEQRTDPEQQPELYASGVKSISFFTRIELLEDMPEFYNLLNLQIRYILNALQGEDVYNELFPSAGKKRRSILFPFRLGDDGKQTGYFYLLEYVANGHLMRITLESEKESRLRVSGIPHLVIDSINLARTDVDIPNTALILTHGILEACAYQKCHYRLSKEQLQEDFSFLHQMELAEVLVCSFSWPAGFQEFVLSAGKSRIHLSIARILHFVSSTNVSSHIKQGYVIKLQDDDIFCYLTLSQRNRCLNLSFMEQVEQHNPSQYLDKMTLLAETSQKEGDAFRNTRTLLIHHMTNEVFGFIQALANMGIQNVETLWVKYAGPVEFSHKEIIHSLPEEIFRFHGLIPVIEKEGISARYLLAEDYTHAEDLNPLADLLREKPYGFFEAMVMVAGHLFLRTALKCIDAREKLMIIEDGGYIAPVINRLCLEERTLREVAVFFHFPQEEIGTLDIPFKKWLEPVFSGSVEHTRNGYDAIMEVENKFGSLAFPSLTIALSDFKINYESSEVIFSCIHAAENILDNMGFSLTYRSVLLLGAQGALGRKAIDILSFRIIPGKDGSKKLYGVDLVKPEGNTSWTWAPDLSSLPPEALKEIDFIFGIIGKSICSPDWIEKLLLATEKKDLFFLSGSTKTVEFSDLSKWLSELKSSPHPQIGGYKVGIELSEIHNSKTGVYEGRTVHLTFMQKTVRLHLLADLMPIDFLYYGVPSETMNFVMNELLKMTSVLASAQRNNRLLPAKLLALDHQISAEGELIDENG